MEKEERDKGKLIVFEGTDCSGKTTQISKIIKTLNREGKEVVMFDFPDYTTPTGRIVKRYLAGEFGPADNVDANIASIFYALDRFFQKPLIEKALGEGKVVILDRYVESNMGHQGGKIRDREKRKDFFEWLDELEYKNFSLPKPDLVVFLYMPLQVARELKRGRDSEQTERVIDGHEDNINHLRNAEESYLQLVEVYNWVKINCAPDGTVNSLRTEDQIAKEIYDHVIMAIGK